MIFLHVNVPIQGYYHEYDPNENELAQLYNFHFVVQYFLRHIDLLNSVVLKDKMIKYPCAHFYQPV
jgi:hypothetical protein